MTAFALVSGSRMAVALCLFAAAHLAAGTHHDAPAAGDTHATAGHGDETHAAAGHASSTKYVYDPDSRVDPFDTASQAVSRWVKTPIRDNTDYVSYKEGWKGKFCRCAENARMTGWYQYNPFMYVLDQCSEDDGFVLRTGHLQDRFRENLQSEMACDVLKVITYCFSQTCPEALPSWNSQCRVAHYSVPGCNVDCSAAAPHAGRSVAAALVALLAGASALLFA